MLFLLLTGWNVSPFWITPLLLVFSMPLNMTTVPLNMTTITLVMLRGIVRRLFVSYSHMKLGLKGKRVLSTGWNEVKKGLHGQEHTTQRSQTKAHSTCMHKKDKKIHEAGFEPAPAEAETDLNRSSWTSRSSVHMLPGPKISQHTPALHGWARMIKWSVDFHSCLFY